ncbi:hypothetical protein OAG63_01585 [Methylacidiphilales bacterium]|nr:hypothetical protein [Candidatus Methylacidiphilales bacterium]
MDTNDTGNKGIQMADKFFSGGFVTFLPPPQTAGDIDGLIHACSTLTGIGGTP